MTKRVPKLSEQIRKLIDESGHSRYRIALDCEIDKGLMSRFMAGKATISMASLDRLADYLRWQIVATKKKHTEE